MYQASRSSSKQVCPGQTAGLGIMSKSFRMGKRKYVDKVRMGKYCTWEWQARRKMNPGEKYFLTDLAKFDNQELSRQRNWQ
jgi:hypothetical protein